MLPNTFIAGVQKCGTTALHYMLAQHPDIFFPRAPQEIHFFDLDGNFRKGIEWYESLFREWNGQRIVAQTSPLYLFEPSVSSRIHAVIPDASFIVILRNPVDRAYSHYWHEVKHGAETLSFEAALDKESERIREGFEGRRHFSYVGRGEYATQLSRYFHLFPREQFLVLRFEDLAQNPDHLLGRCADFLQVSLEGFAEARQTHGVRNSARLPRSRLAHTLARALTKWSPRIGNAVNRVNLKPTQYAPMQSATRQLLQRRLEDEVRRTASLTGLDLGAWLR